MLRAGVQISRLVQGGRPSIARGAVLLKNTNGGKSMPSIVERRARATTRALAGALIAGAVLGAAAGSAAAQTYGFATMQPGTLNHTSASAVAKVLKEKAGANVVVQPTAGESVLIPLISRGEAEFGIANIFEVEQAKQSSPNIRLIGSLHPLRGAFWV